MTTSNNVQDTDPVRADRLKPGDWVFPKARHADSAPAHILFRSEPEGGYVILVMRVDGCSVSETITAGTLFVRATDREIADEQARTRRKAFADRLRQLASLVQSNPGLPLGGYPHITFTSGMSRAELDEVARLTGIEVTRTHSTSKYAEVRFGDYDSFHATWSGVWSDEPEQVERDAAAVVAKVVTGAGGDGLVVSAGTGVGGTGATVVPTPKPAPPKKAAVKRAAAVDKTRAARDQDDANTRPAGADQ